MTRPRVNAVLALWLVLASTLAHADDDTTKPSYRVTVDRVELEPSTLTGFNLRVYLSALSLGGQLLDLSEHKSIKLYLGSGEKKNVPYALGTYGATASDTAIVILVQSTIDYTDVMPTIADSIDRDLFGSLSDRTQVAVLQFGESTGTGKLAPIKSMRGKVILASDNSAGDPTLLDTLDRALLMLKKAKTTPEGQVLRKIVVVVGDGRDLAADNERVTRAGMRAAKEGVRIHSIAYSANDVRRPMLALGELSKRSLGTFRWVRKATADSWKAAFVQLHDEITKQYVVTFFLGADEDVASKKMHIVTAGRTEATSNEVKIGTPTCGGAECASGYCAGRCMSYKAGGGRGVLGWILLIGGILLGLMLVLGVIGFFMTKAQQQAQPQPPAPHHPGLPPQPKPPKPKRGPNGAKPANAGKRGKKRAQTPPPGFLPNGRPIPALMITSGPRTGERHLLRHGFMIGKQPGCDLLFEDGFTSGHHAQIAMDPEGNCAVYDRGSTNGTFINNTRITESALQHGCTLKIGSTEMRFLAQ